MLGRPHESAFPLVAHLWRLPQGERWWVLPESLLLTKTPAETRSRSQKPSMKIPQLLLWVHTGQHRGGKRLQSHVEDWGLCPLQQRPKGHHSAQHFALALERGGFVLRCCRSGGSAIQVEGAGSPTRAGLGAYQGSHDPRELQWASSLAVVGASWWHSAGWPSSLQLWPGSLSVA